MQTEMPMAKQVNTQLALTVCLMVKYRMTELEPFYQEICDALNKTGWSFEVIIMAPDLTEAEHDFLVEFCRSKSGMGQNVKVLKAGRLTEKASILKAAEKGMSGDIVLVIETGGRIHEGDLARLLGKIDEGYDFVNGVRNWKGEPLINQWQSLAFNRITRIFSGTAVHDLNSTVKIFRREVLRTVTLYGDFYRFLPILAEQKGFKIAEIPIERRGQQKRHTIYGPVSYIRRFLDILNLTFVTRFTEKPLRFFGGIGMLFTLLGLAINIHLVVEKLVRHEGLADRPLLLLGILLLVVGIQFISLGLLGEMIVYSRTRDFRDSGLREPAYK